MTPPFTITSFCGVPCPQGSNACCPRGAKLWPQSLYLDVLSELLSLRELSLNAKGPEDPFFFPSVTFTLWQLVQRRGRCLGGTLHLAKPPQAIRSWVPSKFRISAPLRTRWPGVTMYGSDHRLCQVAFELVTSPCLDSHLDLISLCVEWDRKECTGCVLARVYLHTGSLVRAQDFYSRQRLEELQPTVKAVTFSERSQASVVSPLGWGET